MIELKNGDNVLIINQMGFIEFWSKDTNVHPDKSVYMLFFKDHTQLDPTCKHLDTSSLISNIKYDSTDVPCFSCTKNIEGILVEYKIQLFPDGFSWKISLLNDYPNGYRFGIVYPTQKGSEYRSLDKVISTPLSVYFNKFKQTFRGQTDLQIPILSANKRKCISFFSNFRNNVQYFINTDESFDTVRSTASTNETDSFSIHVYAGNLTEMKRLYADMFPGSDKILNKWKKKIYILESYQSISVKVYRGEPSSYKIGGRIYKIEEPEDSDLETFCSFIISELSKYKTVLKDLNLDGIYLGSNISKKEEHESVNIGGGVTAMFPETQRWLVLDVAQINPWLIHHEIWHLIEAEVGANGFPEGNIDLFKTHFGYSPTSPVEYNYEEFRADLFGYLMFNKKRIIKISENNKLLSEQIGVLIDLSKEHVVWESAVDTSVYDDRVVFMVNGPENKKIPFGKMANARIFVSDLDQNLIDQLICA